MDKELTTVVRDRLEGAGLDQGVAAMVVAACTGTPLEAADTATWPDTVPGGDAVGSGTTQVFLDGITVQGFRGIGTSRRLDLPSGPGLTLVVGRNGSGKSSFAEGLEMCLTGESHRWAGRSKAWKETWRNLHDGDVARVDVDVVGLDDCPRTLTHSWPDEGDVDTGRSVLDDGRTVQELGWSTPLAQYRPMLSFNELGGMFDGRPADLYDAIADILGVQPLRDAVEVLRQARLADAKPIKAVKDRRKTLVEELRASADPRADQVLAAIDGRTWDLQAATDAIAEDSTQPTSDLARLRALATLDSPHPVDATAAATALRDAQSAHAEATTTDAGRADRIAALLRQAIGHVDHDGPIPCPLCGSGTTLDAGWAEEARTRADELAEQAQAVRRADADLTAARRAATALLTTPPDALATASLVGLDASAASTAWATLHGGPDGQGVPEDPLALAAHVEVAVPAVHDAVTTLNALAASTLDAKQDDWRPLVNAVARWVDDAHDALAADVRAGRAKQAETWLAECATEIERARFDPIREAVQGYWDRLRLQSNVSLKNLHLQRSGARRSLELDVAVDDRDASALGVMSQGELHALALAVFLPRATLDASPFRFLVLDDPVQAMDPSKVEGLARVLAEVAETRQVIVLTHDTRLPDAVRQLQIEATVVEVQRRARSVVDLKVVDDPVGRHLDDAHAIARTADLKPAVRARLVAQMGRGAVEALSVELVRRRRLGRGEAHHAVDRLLADASTHDLLTLALFDNDTQGDQLFPTLNRWGRSFADVFNDCKKGAHVGERRITDEREFVRQLRNLIDRIRREAS